jgi:ABC-type uncharacterized transport system involved in gliding motility auxiliary subunit
MFLAGLLLLLLGALWTTIDTTGYLPRFVFVTGALLLALFFIRNAGAIRYLLGQARAHAEPGPTTTLLLLALVFALAALLTARLWPAVDLTAERLNSLSSASRQTLAQLQAPLRIEGYFADPSSEWGLARRLFTLYGRGSRSVDTVLRDPDRDPARAREAGVQRTGVIVISSGAARVLVPELSEEAITQGILSVLEGRPRRVGLVQGHGEPAFSIGGDQGITAWIQELATANVQMRAVRLLEGDAVPEELDALLIVAPRTPLFSSEIGLLRRYLDRGGRIGVWAEPQDSTGLEELLGFYYLRLLPGTIRDEGRVTAGIGLGPWSPALVGDPRHAVTAGLASFVVAPGARAMEIETPHPMDLTAEPILKTAGAVDVFADPQASSGAPLRRGIQTVGAVLEWSVPAETASGTSAAGRADLPRVVPQARILVLGDASMLTNRFLGTAANRDLAVSAVHWLTAQEHFLGSARERSRPAQLRLGTGGLRTLLYAIEFGLPAVLIGVGIAVWLRRRGGGA